MFQVNINYLWILSSLLITFVSLLGYKGNPRLEDSSLFFFFQVSYFLIVWFLDKKNLISAVKLKKKYYLIGVVLILFSQPLFENDHYRYIWEGRVFANGGNPYTDAPNASTLNGIDYNKKESIGFKHLTTVYPPASILWFSVGGAFSSNYRVGLIILMILNSILVFILLKRIENYISSTWLLILIIPLLQKEYIQSIHIDLFAFMFVFPFLLDKNRNYFKSWILIFLSIFSKVIGIFFVYPFIMKHYLEKKRKVSFWFLNLSLLFSFPLFYFYLTKINGVNGFEAFSREWVWNPGFYSLLTRLFLIEENMARTISFVSFIVFVSLLGIVSLSCYMRNKFMFEKTELWILTYLFFSSLIFFTPVYNAWYVIWFLVPALLLNLKFGVFYAFFSFTCYMKYLNPDWLPYGELMGHIFFLPSVFECKKLLQSNLSAEPTAIREI
jgi:alpha-1,6-mannosyltransferase